MNKPDIKREEALGFLRRAVQWCQDTHMPGHRNASAALAALSSPCAYEGWRLVGEGSARVNIHGDRGYVDPHVKLDTLLDLEDGQIITALIFAPPVEEAPPAKPIRQFFGDGSSLQMDEPDFDGVPFEHVEETA